MAKYSTIVDLMFCRSRRHRTFIFAFIAGAYLAVAFFTQFYKLESHCEGAIQ